VPAPLAAGPSRLFTMRSAKDRRHGDGWLVSEGAAHGCP
jgi:hypothetical protein